MHVLCELDVPPLALFRACCTCVKITLNIEMAGVMLRSSPRSLLHLCREVVHTFLGMAASATRQLILLSRGEAHQVVNCVQVPPDDRLTGGPCPISLSQLL